MPPFEVHGGHVKRSRLLGACFSRRSVSRRGHLQTFRGDEDVQGVLTLVRRGAAQVVCHVLRVEELSGQLEVEEEDGDRQEEEEEAESGEGRIKEKQPPHTWMTMDECFMAQNLSHEM